MYTSSQESIKDIPSSPQIYEIEEVDASSESFFPVVPESQSDTTDINIIPKQTGSLTELSGARPIYPLATVSPQNQILLENVRASCLAKLADPNIFLTDVTINAFCVSFYN